MERFTLIALTLFFFVSACQKDDVDYLKECLLNTDDCTINNRVILNCYRIIVSL